MVLTYPLLLPDTGAPITWGEGAVRAPSLNGHRILALASSVGIPLPVLARADAAGRVYALDREGKEGIWRMIGGRPVFLYPTVPAYAGTHAEALEKLSQDGIKDRAVLLTTSRASAKGAAEAAVLDYGSGARAAVVELRVPVAQVLKVTRGGLWPGEGFSYVHTGGVPAAWIVNVHDAAHFAEWDESKHPRQPKGDEKGGEFASHWSAVPGGKTEYTATTATMTGIPERRKKEEAFKHANYLKGLGYTDVKVTRRYVSHTIPGRGIGGTTTYTVHHGQPKTESFASPDFTPRSATASGVESRTEESLRFFVPVVIGVEEEEEAFAFDPDQPRAAKGSPDGGQWLRASDTAADAALQKLKTLGHGRKIKMAEVFGQGITVLDEDAVAKVEDAMGTRSFGRMETVPMAGLAFVDRYVTRGTLQRMVEERADVARSYRKDAPYVVRTQQYGDVMLDGHHRAVAAWLLGDRTVQAKVLDVKKVFAEWDEAKHPRHGAGDDKGGEFAPAGSGPLRKALSQKQGIVYDDSVDRVAEFFKKHHIGEFESPMASHGRATAAFIKITDGIEQRLLASGISAVRDSTGNKPLESLMAEIESVARGKVYPTDRKPLTFTDFPYAGEDPRRSLYVHRPVLNAEAIIAWAKGAGFATTLPAEDMHVTVCFSKQPVNWAEFAEWDESKHPRQPKGDEKGGEFAPDESADVQLVKDAAAIAAMDPETRDNTEIGDLPGHATAYDLYEARKMLPKPSDKLKRVNDNNSFNLWTNYDYIANVKGRHFGVNKWEDPDASDKDNESGKAFVYAFKRLDQKGMKMRELTTNDRGELFREMERSAAFDSQWAKWEREAKGKKTFSDQPTELVITDGTRTVEPLGEEGAVVLKFESALLQARHQEFRNNGASWDYDSYFPHISISYAIPEGLDLSTVTPYAGEIVLGAEVFEEVEEGWADDVEEHVQEDEDGVWRTIRGRRVFIRRGEALSEALDRSLNLGRQDITADSSGKVLVYHGSAAKFIQKIKSEGLDPNKEKGFQSQMYHGKRGRAVFLASSPQQAQRWAESASFEERRAGVGVIFRVRLPKEEAAKLIVDRAGDLGDSYYVGSIKPEWISDYTLTRAIRSPTDPGPKYRFKKFATEEKEVYIVALIDDDLPFVEKPAQDSHTDFAQIKRNLDSLELRFAKELAAEIEQARTALIAGVRKAPGKVEGLVLPNAEGIRDALLAGLRRAWDAGEEAGRGEVKGAEKLEQKAYAEPTFTPLAAVAWLRKQAFFAAGLLSQHLTDDVKDVLVQGLKTGSALSVVIESILEVFAPYLLTGEQDEVLPEHRLENIVRTNNTNAYNQGRLAEFTRPDLLPFMEGFRYSAILDSRVTETCRFLDGKVFKPTDPALEELTPANHFNALAEGTLILTDTGEIPIEKVVVGQKVLTHRGRWREVYATMHKPADNGRIKKVALATGKVLTITEEHPVLTVGGWKTVGDLNLGDQLFEFNKDGAWIEGQALVSPKNYPPLFDEIAVPYQITGFLRTLPVFRMVHFQDELLLEEGEVDDVASNSALVHVRNTAVIKEGIKEPFMKRCSFSAPGFGQGLVSPGQNPRHSGGIIGLHTLAGVRAGNAPCPVFFSRVFGHHFGQPVGDADLLLLSSEDDPVSSAPPIENCAGDTQVTFQRTDRLPFTKVFGSDEALDNSFVPEVNHTPPIAWLTPAIISIVEEKEQRPVYNLAVREDQSYHAEGVIVHNCRSLLVPVVAGEEVDEADFITPDEILEAKRIRAEEFPTWESYSEEAFAAWDEAKHPRQPKGSEEGGEFIPTGDLYHVTRTEEVPSIQKKGLIPLFRGTNWVKAGNKERLGGGKIYVFENEMDARRWAARMEWAFYQKFGGGKISIVKIKPDGSKWLVDTNDPLSQHGSKGKWLKREGRVPAKAISSAAVFTPEMGKSLVGQYSEEDEARYVESWDESKHPRHEKGSEKGGEFAPKGGPADNHKFSEKFETELRDRIESYGGPSEENDFTTLSRGEALRDFLDAYDNLSANQRSSEDKKMWREANGFLISIGVYRTLAPGTVVMAGRRNDLKLGGKEYRFNSWEPLLGKGHYTQFGAWDESKHPKQPEGSDKGGEFAPKGPPGVMVFHGTTTEVLDKIKQQGLRPQAELDRVWNEDFFKGERGRAVFVTMDRNLAEVFAGDAAGAGGGHPVVVEIKVSGKEWLQYRKDVGLTAREKGFYRIGGIPPERLVVAYGRDEQQWRPKTVRYFEAVRGRPQIGVVELFAAVLVTSV